MAACLSLFRPARDAGSKDAAGRHDRAARPDVVLGADLIAGFPTETDDMFRRSYDLIAECGLTWLHVFPYSERPGTPAADMDDQVPEALKSERLQELQDELNRQQIAFNETCVGRTMPVLFDRQGARDGQLVGRSPYMQAVHASLPANLLGEIVSVLIDRAKPNSLSAVADEKREAVA